MNERTIAIVGRPNVGKSALFNRLAGKRIAIVHEQSGVTRDRLAREVAWNDEHFELIDTGGIGNIDNERIRGTIDSGIRRQVDTALEDATVVIFVVDLQTGVTPLDEEVAKILRNGGATVFLAANKADEPPKDAGVTEFDVLGFPSFPISAMHNRGIDPLMEAVVPELPEGGDPSGKEPLKVAVIGRPNVGKSSYVNRLLRNDRVIVSDVPGTTRDSIEVPFMVGTGSQARHYTLIDTAGIRRRGKVDTAVEHFSLIRAEKSIERADVVVLVLDATQGITAQDKKIAAKVVRHRRGCAIFVNKWDLSETTQTKYGPELSRSFPQMDYVPVVFMSAETGYNIRKTIDCVDYVATQVHAQLPTGVLNRALTDATAKVSPPMSHGKRLKIYYATQVGKNPVRIALFCNDPKRLAPNYSTYLVKALRGAFGLEGAPIIIQARSRRKEDTGQ